MTIHSGPFGTTTEMAKTTRVTKQDSGNFPIPMVATNFVESETTAGELQGYFPGNSLADDCQGRTRTTGVISKRHLATEEIT
ncbi:hypothetical protein OUZ56_031338 [Daphnia magna]|uniref:Uncharacterized protein n=1 Tax=Daphnia magna TaxID=35525 RepID=A0ABQ9ZTY8_9CRUS|nr:hypothetical protein OUZ56_031338 [Daphnia magna]